MHKIRLSKTKRRALSLLLRPQSAEEKALLEENKKVRHELTLAREDGLAYRMRIPYRHVQALKLMIPEMQDHQPKEEQKAAWHWFLRDELSKPYRIKANA